LSEAIGPGDVVAFWQEAGPDKWFKKDEAFDEALRARFLALHARAAAGELSGWAKDAEGTLALILVLDQFSRNMFRGSPRTFAQDAMARDLAVHALEAGYDGKVDPALKFFLYMPFMHSEAIADQERCVLLFHAAAGVGDGLKHAHEHADIIRRFGRFPHRNAVLGRHTTPAERAFLEGGGFAG